MNFKVASIAILITVDNTIPAVTSTLGFFFSGKNRSKLSRSARQLYAVFAFGYIDERTYPATLESFSDIVGMNRWMAQSTESDQNFLIEDAPNFFKGGEVTFRQAGGTDKH